MKILNLQNYAILLNNYSITYTMRDEILVLCGIGILHVFSTNTINIAFAGQTKFMSKTLCNSTTSCYYFQHILKDFFLDIVTYRYILAWY